MMVSCRTWGLNGNHVETKSLTHDLIEPIGHKEGDKGNGVEKRHSDWKHHNDVDCGHQLRVAELKQELLSSVDLFIVFLDYLASVLPVAWEPTIFEGNGLPVEPETSRCYMWGEDADYHREANGRADLHVPRGTHFKAGWEYVVVRVNDQDQNTLFENEKVSDTYSVNEWDQEEFKHTGQYLMSLWWRILKLWQVYNEPLELWLEFLQTRISLTTKLIKLMLTASEMIIIFVLR